MFLAALNYSTIITKNMMFQNLICFWSFGRFLLIVLNRIDMISFYKKWSYPESSEDIILPIFEILKMEVVYIMLTKIYLDDLR